MALADFDINADGGDQGFDGTNSQALSFTLRTNPPNGITSWRLETWDASGFVASLPISTNPPRASKSAPELTLVGATSGQSVSPVNLTSAITTTLPSSGSHSWILRSVVNNGVNADGSVNPEYVRERIVAIRSSSGGRKVVVTETTQYEQDGWAGAIGEGIGAATGDADGFLSRNVYVNAGSAHVSTTVLGVTAAAAPTWTTAADIPAGNKFRMILYSGGGGGNGGCATEFANNMSGGAGGSAGSRVERWFSRRELIDALPIAWDLPLGGAGGAGASGSGNQVGSVGALPSDDASFGSLATAYIGGLQTNPPEFDHEGGGGGGGLMGRGANGDGSGNPGAGGDPIGGGSTQPDSTFGGGRGGGTVAGGASVHGGGGGAAARQNLTGGTGGASVHGPTGGGGGGGHNSARTTPTDGGPGGARINPDTAGAAAGDPGTDGADATIAQGGMGGGGGNGAVGTVPVTASNGGNGGLGGGGGGGGGSAGSTDSGSNTAGDGGDGGDSLGIFEAYL